ncbi:MAG: hypothetical protein P9M15_00135 [Candidatus Electryoneaceae bacterium]|nr:hypothetical protein [Candidatus Electryoneaceae bacterium]
MIGLNERFGRSERNYNHRTIRFKMIAIALVIVATVLLCPTDGLTLIGGGLYPTRVKFEFQYTDYNSYRHPDPIPPVYPDTLYVIQDPHIADFPEHRILTKITQTLSFTTALQLRYQYSGLSEDKTQSLIYGRLAHDVTDVNNLYGAYQYLEQPDIFKGHMFQFGWRHDRSGWIVTDVAFSYIGNLYDDGNRIDTYAPMLQLRYSLDGHTALLGRWEGYWSSGENDDSQSFIYSLYFSRFLEIIPDHGTALHLGCRYYDNEIGVQSIAPAFEVAQYIFWNLTARLSYRYYENKIDNEEIGQTLEENSVRSHSFRAYVEWEMISDLKVRLKLRRYENNQHILMNTYLLGFEYII